MDNLYIIIGKKCLWLSIKRITGNVKIKTFKPTKYQYYIIINNIFSQTNNNKKNYVVKCVYNGSRLHVPNATGTELCGVDPTKFWKPPQLVVAPLC